MAAWKNAKPLPGDEQAAAGFFCERARRRNPAVALGASGLVGVETDGTLDGPELAAMLVGLGLP